MERQQLRWDETLFRDPEVFEFDYVPEQFHQRDSQMRELTLQIKPGLRGVRPLNTICRGLPGTGKTTSVRKLFAQVEESTRKLVPVHINCQIDNTKYAVFSQIYRKLAGHLPPATGTSFKQLFDAIARLMLKEGAVLVVALDDANYLMYENELNKVLYTLLRSHESYPGTRIGIIIILSDMAVDLNRAVDPRVASVFRPTEIYFPPYSEEEVEYILKQRVMQGFYPGVLSEKMFELAVEQTMKSGDLRVGIDLLKRAALQAEMQGRRRIEREDICRAYEISKNLHLDFTVRALRSEERALLAKIAERSLRDEEMNAGDVFTAVKDDLSIGYTKFYEMLKKFDAMRLVNLHYRDGRGRTRLISLRYEPEQVLSRLK
ncbi:MAG: ORC1-type DNA replication protein [Methanomicrobiales archaeon]|nr:ORC1-type DNA replication protein [Methanomicrobiales archaeon]